MPNEKYIFYIFKQMEDWMINLKDQKVNLIKQNMLKLFKVVNDYKYQLDSLYKEYKNIKV